MEHATWTVRILMVILGAFILGNIFAARRGKRLFIRRIPGLSAIEEAVGRATEMGRPVVFSPGLGSIDLVTLAGLAVLSHVARLTARYRTRLLVLVNDSVVYPVAEEVCRQAYIKEGKLEEFNREDVRYITGDQFGYASGVVGIMMRERAATNLMFGSFYAESLILAEAGQQIGAVQVAGTTSTTQVPFFVASCDYTIIGEELFAASAYLTREPTQLGSLVGQDWGKMLFLAIVAIGVLFATIQGEAANWFLKLISR
jgi:hypothetical protein